MSYEPINTSRKASMVNADKSVYGTFAEIGAGQEVARHFFQAGGASATVAKAISAYDMIFSDQIYGKETSGRYVCESRLNKMLDYEYKLVVQRLKGVRGENTRFFSYANTVTTRNFKGQHLAHGWMGIQFQMKPQGTVHEIILHVRMLDPFVLEQQEAIGVMGVNLIYAAFNLTSKPDDFIDSLTDSLAKNRIEIDMISFHGDDLSHIDNRIMCLKLVQRGLTRAVVFDEKGQVKQATDVFYKKPVFIQRSNFRPVTINHIDIHSHGLETFKKSLGKQSAEPVELMEVTMSSLIEGKETKQIDTKEFLDIADTLSTLGYTVLVSNYELFYEVKNHIAQYTAEPIGVIVSAKYLDKLFEEKYYAHLSGGILEAFGILLNRSTKLLVYPYKLDDRCTTASIFRPNPELKKFYEYLLESKQMLDIAGCDEANLAVHSADVRKLISKKDTKWEKLVPTKAVKLIKERKMFGFKA